MVLCCVRYRDRLWCYALPGTDIGYAATRSLAMLLRGVRYYYGLATPCLVLRSGMVLPGRAMLSRRGSRSLQGTPHGTPTGETHLRYQPTRALRNVRYRGSALRDQPTRVLCSVRWACAMCGTELARAGTRQARRRGVWLSECAGLG
eukprot:745264-Rhodomonas_salina.3